jgi:NAD(P)-dependent dehydrogenase (short-subunit alcohol dehydrogenase family)
MNSRTITSRTLEGRVAIVTGAAAGLGVGIAEALAAAGAAVVIAARRLEAAQAVVDRIQGEGVRALAIRTDVCVEQDIKNLVEQTLGKWGRLDIVVSNASSSASGRPTAFEDIDDTSWFEQWDVSLGAAQCLAREAFPALKASGHGRFFVMSSTQGLHGGSMNPCYSAIKSGLRGFTKSLAREWGPHGILVSAIAPAALTGPAVQYLERNPAFAAQIAATTPLGRLGDPRDDIGRTIVAMCGDDWRYVTGLTLMVDGGSYLAQ